MNTSNAKPPSDTPLNATQPGTLAHGDSVTLAIVEESLEIHKERVETDALRVRKVEDVRSVELVVPLEAERVEIERVAVNRPVDSRFEPYQDGDVYVVPVFEYVPVTEMRLMLKEELRIARRIERTEHSQTVALRRDRLELQRRSAAGEPWQDASLPPAREPASLPPAREPD